ncbi:MAG: hypothetical protein EOL93_04605, partial [Epsilonproteobacteria bacterium]|nr:hypothetical protein [Campylobacterota bacterium]
MFKIDFIDEIQASTIIKISISLLFLIFPAIILFTWQETFSLEKTIEHTKFGTFGDFFGGIIGTILQFCGVLLFYIALKDQRKDFDTNRKVFEKQVEALNLQINEFSLQRTELEETRKVFTEQSKTLKQQRFETTFFSLIDLYHKIISNLNNQHENKNYFKKLKNDLLENFNYKNADINSQYKNALANYTKSFYVNKEELTNYFRIIYRILSTIDNTDLTEKEGPFRILCQSGKITNTQGHRYEDRNRRRAICSR